MKFIVVGYGRVGRPTVERLERSDHTVTVVENNEEKVETIKDQSYSVVHGDGGTESALEEAGVEAADGLAALTGDLETNLDSCTIANEHGCRTVLRMPRDISQEDYERYSEMVDEIVYPERVGAAAAKTALLGGDFSLISALTEDLAIASVTIPEGAPVIGQRVVKIDLPSGSRIYAHGREGKDMTIPLPQTKAEAGDSVAIMADSDSLPEIRAAIRGD